MSELIHATCLLLARGGGVLLAGASGAGKSDLALRLIDRGATLVADDYTELRARHGVLIGAPPTRIAGLLEVRGLGILPFPHVAEAPINLLVDLDGTPDRLPEACNRQLAGIDVPVVALAAFEASAAIKVELALARKVMPA